MVFWANGFKIRSLKAVVGVIVKDGKVLLIRRNRKLKRHAGEIGFPGGMVERGESLEDALRREILEELFLRPGDYTILGRLKPTKTLLTGITIYPFVLTLGENAVPRPNPEEIEELGFVPLEELLPLKERDSTDTPLGVVWGATARIARELLKGF